MEGASTSLVITSSTTLQKNITLVGVKGASITSRSDSEVRQVFEITSLVNLKFVSLRVKGVALIRLSVSEGRASIIIWKCWFEGVTPFTDKVFSSLGHVPYIEVESAENSNITLQITGTTFKDAPAPMKLKTSYTWRSSRFNIITLAITNTTFTGIETYLSIRDAMSATILDTVFDEVKGFVMYVRNVRIQRCRFISVTDLVLIDSRERGSGGRAYFSDVVFENFPLLVQALSIKAEIIEMNNCTVSNISARHHVLAFYYSKNIRIRNLTCLSNSVQRNGGCIDLTNIHGECKLSIEGSHFLNNT